MLEKNLLHRETHRWAEFEKKLIKTNLKFTSDASDKKIAST